MYSIDISTISLSKNPVRHPRAKHIELRHRLFRNHIGKEDIIIENDQLADIFTTP